MHALNHLLYGNIDFLKNEEYRAFQFRFLCILLLAGAGVTALLLAGVASGVNHIDAIHVVSMTCFTLISLVIWLVLRGQPQRYGGGLDVRVLMPAGVCFCAVFCVGR
jgi:O-antigen/teichoic acid export membrane protein